MGILVGSGTRVLVQGITGTQGSFHTSLMLDDGTHVVAGTSPGKRGLAVRGVPVFDTVAEAMAEQTADVSIVFVPAPFAAEAALEALEGGLKLVVVITEHVPVKDAVVLMSYAKQVDATIIGPNGPGVITPGKCKVGIMPAHVFAAGNVGVVSRSGTLTYEVATGLTAAGLGQSTCVGVGGDPVTGLNFVDALKMFRDDPQTKAVVLIGEIGGNVEEYTADYIAKEQYPKAVVAFVAGRSAPVGKRMGHAGAIVMGSSGTAASKVAAFEAAGVKVAQRPGDVANLVARALQRH
jgi:succinyl-CoA synthetase alpha subunit